MQGRGGNDSEGLSVGTLRDEARGNGGALDVRGVKRLGEFPKCV